MKLINAAKKIVKFTAIGVGLLGVAVTVRAFQISQDNAANGQAPKHATIVTPATVKATPAPIKATPAPIKATPAPIKATPAPIKATPIATPAPVKATPKLITINGNVLIPATCDSNLIDHRAKQSEADQVCSDVTKGYYLVEGKVTTLEEYDRYHSAR